MGPTTHFLLLAFTALLALVTGLCAFGFLLFTPVAATAGAGVGIALRAGRPVWRGILAALLLGGLSSLVCWSISAAGFISGPMLASGVADLEMNQIAVTSAGVVDVNWLSLPDRLIIGVGGCLIVVFAAFTLIRSLMKEHPLYTARKGNCFR